MSIYISDVMVPLFTINIYIIFTPRQKLLLRDSLVYIKFNIKFIFQKSKLNSLFIFQGRWHIFIEEWNRRYDSRKMGKFAYACAGLLNIFLHYKVQNPEIEDLISAASHVW